MCKECTAQKREAGTPYRCAQCGLWHAAAHFGSKHQNPRWSMYRVCLSCEAQKKCALCQTKQTKEYFSAAAWKVRHLDRRICLRRQAKTRGHWTCAACKERKSKQQFSVYLQKQPSGQHGTQTCNACHVATVQAAIRKRAAALGAARVEPLRKRIRHMRIVKETWEAIAQQRLTRTRPTENGTKPSNSQPSSALAFTQDQKTVAAAKTPVIQPGKRGSQEKRRHITFEVPKLCSTTGSCEEKTTNEVATGQKMDAVHSSTQQRAVGPDTAPPRLHTYICPYCAKSVQSPVATGRVDHRRGNGCGKQFRVANGLLAGRTYLHACPTCGTVVHSTLASGRIRVTHRNPSGRQCRTNQWRVHT